MQPPLSCFQTKAQCVIHPSLVCPHRLGPGLGPRGVHRPHHLAPAPPRAGAHPGGAGLLGLFLRLRVPNRRWQLDGPLHRRSHPTHANIWRPAVRAAATTGAALRVLHCATQPAPPGCVAFPGARLAISDDAAAHRQRGEPGAEAHGQPGRQLADELERVAGGVSAAEPPVGVCHVGAVRQRFSWRRFRAVDGEPRW